MVFSKCMGKNSPHKNPPHSSCAALGTGQAWPGGADVNLAQQDVFDTLFGSWIMERSTSPEVSGLRAEHARQVHDWHTLTEGLSVCGEVQVMLAQPGVQRSSSCRSTHTCSLPSH